MFQLLAISVDLLNDLLTDSFNHNNNNIFVCLKARMWKSIAIRIATTVLMSISAFESWTYDQISLYLDRGIVPMVDGYSQFVVNENVEDVILIEGEVYDSATTKTFIGPVYIPRTVRMLYFVITKVKQVGLL